MVDTMNSVQTKVRKNTLWFTSASHSSPFAEMPYEKANHMPSKTGDISTHAFVAFHKKSLFLPIQNKES